MAGTLNRALGAWLAVVALALSPVMAQEAPPKKHDEAEARQLLVQAEQIAAKMPIKQMQIVALENIGIGKALAHDYEGARVIARSLGTDVSKEKILRDIAITQALSGDTDEGVKTIGGIKAAEGKVMTCFMMARELAKQERKKEALFALDQITKTALPKVAAGFEQMNAMLLLGQAYAMAGDPTTTSRFADFFKEQPQLAEIRNVMLAIGRAYDHDITGAKQKLALLHNSDTQVMALLGIVDVQLKAGDKAAAADTWKQLVEVAQSKPLKISRLFMVIEMQQEAGDFAAARTTIDIASKVAPAENEAVLSKIGSAQAASGDMDGALKTLMQIKNANEQSNIRYDIAITRAKAGDVPGALAIAPPEADVWGRTQVLIGAARGILRSLKPPAKP
ncbi:MAG: hypothetical protein JWN14_3001 [Chthonomonadales bacterium]|nr:hypothetical protein [Chthonomonadales bacterium]